MLMRSFLFVGLKHTFDYMFPFQEHIVVNNTEPNQLKSVTWKLLIPTKIYCIIAYEYTMLFTTRPRVSLV